MKELTVTCIVERGTQMWYRDSVTGKAHYEVIPTHPSQVRPERVSCLSTTVVPENPRIVSAKLIDRIFKSSTN